MNDEQKPNTHETDYIEAIKKLKAETVDKAEYERLREDNRKLLDSIVNGTHTDDEAAKTPVLREPQEIRKELFKEDAGLSNLEFATKALELRTSLMAKGETDPFLPQGAQILATEEDIAGAQRVADVLQQCVDYASGDNSVFTNELQRRTVDIRRR